jgi:3-oxoacyl-(acyl-carrier-protein) synthase
MDAVVITGLGAVSAAGQDVAANFATLLSGKPPWRASPSLFPVDFAHPVFECDSAWLEPALLPASRTQALCRRAVAEAVADAGLSIDDLAGPGTGIALGTTVACTLNNLPFYRELREGGSPDMAPVRRYLDGDLASGIARELGATGPTLTVANACSSGANAIGAALSWLRSGRCERVLAGGADELNLVPYCGFHALQVMSPVLCTPFAAHRQGLNLGEGAGILILETVAAAARRRHDATLFLRGYGCAGDAWHLTGPHPDGRGLRQAIAAVLDNAGANAADVVHLNTHGTATRDNDAVEATVYHDVFGSEVVLSATKAYTGHTLGAAGAIEAVFCAGGIRRGLLPGNPTLTDPDPALPIHPARYPTPYSGGMVLSSSLAFGGNCAVLAFSSCPGTQTKPMNPETLH